MERKFIIGGNWKMNKLVGESESFVKEFIPLVRDVEDKVDIVLFPPYFSVKPVAELLKGSKIAVGAQNMYYMEKGAYTGEISPSMLLDTGATYVLLGHSERRKYFGETNELVAKKLLKAYEKNIHPVVCIGETKEEREKGLTEQVLEEQIKGSLKGISKNDMLKTTIAYEPVWAIGTGITATPVQAQDAHEFIRKTLSKLFDEETAEKIRIQYGGSIKPNNASSLFTQPDVDGGLVGGASLDPKSFNDIIRACLD
ncbi:MAG: triose-phosphate isomerase [Promethearchaeota archaeon]